MKAFVLREMTFLKVLHPLIQTQDLVFYLDVSLGAKEYNRCSPAKLKLNLSNNTFIPFKTEKELHHLLIIHNITELVSLEMFLWLKETPKITTHNYLYLTDTLWQEGNKFNYTYQYYPNEWLRDLYLKWGNVELNPKRDLLYKYLIKTDEPKTHELVLLPNLNQYQFIKAFKNEANFMKIIDSIVKPNTLFKARKKQYLPAELKQKYEILMDDELQYPSTTNRLLNKSKVCYMFYSSAIWECRELGVPVINIPIDLGVWNWNRTKLEYYFKEVYK